MKVGETPNLTGESVGETHEVLEHTETHPPGNQHLKQHNPLEGREGSDKKWGKSQRNGIVPSLTPPTQTTP